VSRFKHVFRIGTLVVPSWLAWYFAASAFHRELLTRLVTFALGPLWVSLGLALLMRAASVILFRRRDAKQPILAQIDVLTSAGTVLGWTSAFMIMGAVSIGWASLAIVGMLGTAVFHAAVILAFVALRGANPMRKEKITRRFSPDTVTEGDAVTEEIHLCGARIPIGFRLFVSGRVGPRWASSRHVVESTQSGADIVLESDVGPAVRGQHLAEPLVVWLQDTFGICRSLRVEVAPASLVVLPKLRAVEKPAALVQHGLGVNKARATRRLPTEGCFDVREYKQGDDVRRIQWVRSLAVGELVVRLPDETPPDRPRIRLVLDTFFPEALAMSGDTAPAMLDPVVDTWLALGRALVESGSRVTLVTAVYGPEGVTTMQQELSLRATSAALRLAASATWQSRIPVEAMLTDEATYVVSRAVLAPPPPNPKIRWVVVAPRVPLPPPPPFASAARHPHTIGSSENRWSQRGRAMREWKRAWTEHGNAVLSFARAIVPPPPGSFRAKTADDGSIQLEALR